MEDTYNATQWCFKPSFNGKELLTQTYRLVLAAFSAVVVSLALLANSSVIFVLVKTEQLHNTSLRLLLLLSISDCLFAAIGGTSYCFILMENLHHRYCTLELVAEFSLILFGRLSAYILVLIAFDRYCRIKYLTGYSQVFSKKRTYIGITVTHLLALSIPTLKLCGRKYDNDTLLEVARIMSKILDICVLSLGITVYILAIKSTKKHRKSAQI